MGKTLQRPIQRLINRPSPSPQSAGAPASLVHGTPGGPIEGVHASRDLPSPITVSVICPSYQRHHRHAHVLQMFESQDYPHKDFWLLDDSDAPSPTFKETKDPNVHYVHSGKRTPIGPARNRLIAMSAGSVIAHFDDDDWYSPKYLSSMVGFLTGRNADLVKLAVWKERKQNGQRSLYDGRKQSHADLWGWGFSYVYRRYVATRLSFPVEGVEDYPFVCGIQKARMKTELIFNGSELAEHVWHGDNSTKW